MRKKIISAVAVVLMMVMVVSSAASNSSVMAADVNATKEYFEVENVLDYELEDWSYRMEIVERLEKEEYFSSDEKTIYRQHGYTFDEYAVKKYDAVYHYPVLVQTESSLIMYYTDNWGDINKKTILGISKDFGGSIGNLHSAGTNAIHQTKEYLVEYDTETGYMTVYQFNKKIREEFIGKNAIYTGKSEFEGYIFRLGTDVYAVRYDCITVDSGVYAIAHNVKEVVVADYYYSSDGFSQPLFLMTDGTLKVYGGPAGERPDDEENLLNVRYEGGYDK